MCLRVMQVDTYSTYSQHHRQKHTGDISAHVRMFAVRKVCSKDKPQYSAKIFLTCTLPSQKNLGPVGFPIRPSLEECLGERIPAAWQRVHGCIHQCLFLCL